MRGLGKLLLNMSYRWGLKDVKIVKGTYSGVVIMKFIHIITYLFVIL